MANTKKLYSDYTEVITSQLTDKIPTLQNGNKVTTLQKIYNLFLSAFQGVFSVIQDTTEIPIDASITGELTTLNCVLSVINIPGGTGNKEIKMRLAEGFLISDWVDVNLRYKGFDINLRSWDIYEETGNVYLSIYINVHSNPTEPILIAIRKSN